MRNLLTVREIEKLLDTLAKLLKDEKLLDTLAKLLKDLQVSGAAEHVQTGTNLLQKAKILQKNM